MDRDMDLTKGAKDLLGDPKKAVVKVGAPMMLGMFIQSIYNVVDGFWVAGLGANELAAVGLFFPFFMIIVALGVGTGVGGSSAISRKIGDRDKEGASRIAAHTVVSGILISMTISVILLPFSGAIFTSLSGNGEVGRLATEYANILLAGAIVLIFSNIANAILRGEGDAKKAMYGLIVGSVLNMFLDPIFIYVLDMGIGGAAVSTVVSMSIGSALFIYWLFFQRKTYVDIKLRGFSFDFSAMKEIFKVGIPSSLMQIVMSFTIIVLNTIIIMAGGTDGVAVYTTGWRIVMIGIVPLIGLSTGVTAVTGAAFGERNEEKLNTAFLYSVKLGILIEAFVGVIVFFFAPYLAQVFTYSEGAARIFPDLVRFLKITVFFYPAVPLGMFTSSLFQGIGKGVRSLIVTVLRNVVFAVSLCYILGVSLGYGLVGIWLGIVLGNIAGAFVSFTWGRVTVNNIFR